MRTNAFIVAAVLAGVGVNADAHFVLITPAASLVQSKLGDPQKMAPCGGVSANLGTPSGAVTHMTGGSRFHLMLSETIFHPGHYRVALAKAAATLPADPEVTTRDTERGAWSVSADIQSPPAPPILADGLFAHTERPVGFFEADIDIPNVTCTDCVLQVIQFMAEHARNADGDYSYHHCANVNITADSSKPIDGSWVSQLK